MRYTYASNGYVLLQFYGTLPEGATTVVRLTSIFGGETFRVTTAINLPVAGNIFSPFFEKSGGTRHEHCGRLLGQVASMVHLSSAAPRGCLVL